MEHCWRGGRCKREGKRREDLWEKHWEEIFKLEEEQENRNRELEMELEVDFEGQFGGLDEEEEDWDPLLFDLGGEGERSGQAGEGERNSSAV